MSRPIDLILSRLSKVSRSGGGWSAKCPAHDDRRPSLSVSEGLGGKVLIHCHAGCTFEEVIAALGFVASDLFVHAAVYPYHEENGDVRYEVVRFYPKDFRVRRPDGTGAWKWGLNGLTPLLYRLPEVSDAIQAGERVYVVEGERDVESLRARGLVATCNPFGAMKWRPEFSKALRGASVVVLPDEDEIGWRHARAVADSLHETASVKIVQLPGLPPGEDVSHWLANGGAEADLEQLASAAPVWNPSSRESLAREQYQRPLAPGEADWPILHSAALHGIAGEFVALISPESESDPAALLVQFLVAFGNIIGNGPHFLVEASRHALNLYAVLVGRTSKGRKGTSEAHVRRLMRRVDRFWAEDHIVSGLSSGEGLIWHVRDQSVKREGVTKGGKITGKKKICMDQGVRDKRLLVVEPEFASVLRVMKRDGSTLSPILRCAWDGGNLRSLTKNSPLRAKRPHISAIGHISSDELRRELATLDFANGLANRFLFVCVKRSQYLAEGGQIDETRFRTLAGRLQEAREFVTTVGHLSRSEAARALWKELYPVLSAERGGLFGAVTGRAEAHVVRLSCVYAILDKSHVVEVEHLRAAVSVWQYCEDSCRYVFGEPTGNPLADSILRALRKAPHGLTRTEIRDFLDRNRKRHAIDDALNLLAGLRLAVCHEEVTKGRRRHRWLASVWSYMSYMSSIESPPAKTLERGYVRGRDDAETNTLQAIDQSSSLRHEGALHLRHKRSNGSNPNEKFEISIPLDYDSLR